MNRERLRVLDAERAAPEFAPRVDEAPSELDRRDMMKLLAAGAALATGSLTGCMQEPRERIMPRVDQSPELTPGVPLEYATAMTIDGFATGLLVRTYEARPTKVEGNPDHPASLGATNAFHQASLLELYDPQRAKTALDAGTPISLESVVREIAARERIAGLWFLLRPQSSPTLLDLMARIRTRHPGARFAFYSPVGRRAVYEGAQLAFGQPVESQYRFDAADVVVSLDADFTATMPGSVRWARDFATRRRAGWTGAAGSRLYVAEPRPTPTGSLADHRLPVRPSELVALASELLAIVRGQRPRNGGPRSRQRWLSAAAQDLLAQRGRGLVIAGDRQPARVHAIVHAINQTIAAAGATVSFTQPALIDPLGDGLPELAAALRAGDVNTLVIADANPVYSADPALAITAGLASVADTIYAGTHHDETARLCRRFVPLAHYMESWADARAYDGTISLIQPLIRPMYESIGLIELLAAFAGDPYPSAHRLLRDRYAQAGEELAWRRMIQRGVVPASALPALDVAANVATIAAAVAERTMRIELAFDASCAVYDGRFANNAWLQELPKPHDKITWGNAAVMSPATARELGMSHEDVARISVDSETIELPVYVLPGHADHCVTLELGYGRWAAGHVGDGVGVNVYRMRALYGAGAAVTLAATGSRNTIAVTQQHFDQQGRGIALAATLAEYRVNPHFTAEHWGPTPTMLPEPATRAWGMTIDTSICTGCSSCVVACQAENNIPVVGRKGVIDNREMHWLRIDTYRETRGDDATVVHQPMLCQHCENAPCEYVCPTYATQHSPDGLNEMIYNRCIGTRFCSNNCPYKVRRFNWFDYTEDTPKTQQLQRNPNVTVRARGVMEKCTYCVQRIRGAEIEARKAKRDIRPNEVTTACQQACPTGAIQFGLLSHEGTGVVEWRKEPRHYAVLHELGTRPRTVYLAKLTNPRVGPDE